MENAAYPEPIPTIHAEVMTSANNALKQARSILRAHKNSAKDKAERLIASGFKNAQESKELTALTKSANEERKNIEVIKHFQFKYPSHKFILLRDVKTICKKYGLVYGQVELFTGFVPEIKLKEVENFVVDSTDRQLTTIPGWGSPRKSNKSLDAFTTRQRNLLIKGRNIRIRNRTNWGYWRTTTFCLESMMIIAPPQQMEMTGKQIRNHKVVDIIKDPVVLCPVKGGYLVVTAWGDEASDPIIVNQKLN